MDAVFVAQSTVWNPQMKFPLDVYDSELNKWIKESKIQAV